MNPGATKTEIRQFIRKSQLNPMIRAAAETLVVTMKDEDAIGLAQTLKRVLEMVDNGDKDGIFLLFSKIVNEVRTLK